MAPTDKVLGQIAAISTFIENFPMSILDMMQGKTYTSIFDFMIEFRGLKNPCIPLIALKHSNLVKKLSAK